MTLNSIVKNINERGGIDMKYMRLEDIKIKDSFINSVPKEAKVNVCRKYWDEMQEQDRYIVVDHNNFLIDGYIQYLVLKENNIHVVEVKISDKKRRKWSRKNKQLKAQKSNQTNYRKCETVYVYGIHLNSNDHKERVWRIPNSWRNDWADTLNIGDSLLVKTKYGLAPIQITKIETLSTCPVDIPVNTIVKKLKKKEDVRL